MKNPMNFDVRKNRSCPPARLRTVTNRLLVWYEAHARDLPWRRTRDPYAIWISEIMLQQTQVITVIPYWERWMKALPNVRSLARARPEKVLKLWEGLGYYRRARHLHEAAKVIVTRHGGKFPRAFDDVLALPGVGRYTAGAIGSIAFHQPLPILDGNVTRVLARLFAIQDPVDARATQADLWSLAERLVETASRRDQRTGRSAACSHLNQALMELGALVCTPANPDCNACPTRGICAAHRRGLVASLPVLPRKTQTTARTFLALVIEQRGSLLVRKRPADAVNGGLWEFPNLETTSETKEAAGRWLERWGLASQPLNHVITVKHSITRYRMTVDAFAVAIPRAARLPRDGGQWMNESQLRSLPLASAHLKILNQYLRRRNEPV